MSHKKAASISGKASRKRNDKHNCHQTIVVPDEFSRIKNNTAMALRQPKVVLLYKNGFNTNNNNSNCSHHRSLNSNQFQP